MRVLIGTTRTSVSMKTLIAAKGCSHLRVRYSKNEISDAIGKRRFSAMGKSFGVCRVSGIDVKVHWSCLLLLSFFAMVGHQVAESVAGAVVAVGMIGELFLCVLRASSQKQLTGAGDARRCASHPTMSAVGGRDA